MHGTRTMCSDNRGVRKIEVWIIKVGLYWPDIQYPDIYNYFVATPSGHTKEELKAYKSLEGYKYFVDGWISDILVLPIPSCPSAYMVSGQVKHSQRLSASPFKLWVAVQKDGVVVCAHCDCMAGLGEACSHIAALLFTLDANTQVKKGLSCTSVSCYWLPPTFKSVPFARIYDIDFTTPQKKKRKLLDLQIHPPTNAITTPSPLNLPIPTTNVKASETELECLYKAHSKQGNLSFFALSQVMLKHLFLYKQKVHSLYL